MEHAHDAQQLGNRHPFFDAFRPTERPIDYGEPVGNLTGMA